MDTTNDSIASFAGNGCGSWFVVRGSSFWFVVLRAWFVVFLGSALVVLRSWAALFSAAL
jgi:hypothetical protein